MSLSSFQAIPGGSREYQLVYHALLEPGSVQETAFPRLLLDHAMTGRNSLSRSRRACFMIS